MPAALFGAAVLAAALTQGPNTYTVQDGERVLVLTTEETEPMKILEAAGVSLGEADKLRLCETEDGCVLQVLRCCHVTVDHCGQILEAEAWEETVGQLLQRLEIPVESGMTVSVPDGLPICNGMQIRIRREFRQEQIYTAAVPYETVCCYDPTLPAGTKKILTHGSDGELLRRAEVTYLDGKEVSRRVLSEQMLVVPVNALVAIGTGGANVPRPEYPVIGDGLIRLPDGEVLTYSKVISSLATAYCDKGKTATGTQARVGAIAVDPTVIPYGTRMFIVTKDGSYIYGIATAEDCGSKKFIYGTRIDLHYDTEYECRQFGARMCWVYFLS